MGTWGTALYADDVAAAVRDEFVELFSRSRDSGAATSALLQSMQEQIADTEDGPLFWLALAETKWRYGCLDDIVRARAMEVIDQESDLQRWPGTDLQRRRVQVLALKKKLQSQQPKARIPKRRKMPDVPATKIMSPDDRALATVYALRASNNLDSPKTQVIVEMLSSGSRGGGGVFLATCAFTEVQLDWLDRETLSISYPAQSVVLSQSESTFYNGRTIQVVYRAQDA